MIEMTITRKISPSIVVNASRKKRGLPSVYGRRSEDSPKVKEGYYGNPQKAYTFGFSEASNAISVSSRDFA